jgi:cyclic beta-1,2-glucan synthetase
MTALFVIGWLLSPLPAAWSLWLLAIFAMPPLVASIMDLFNRPADLPLAAHLRQAGHAARANFAPVPLTLACLPFEAVTSLDAIGRTLWRSLVTRRHLLKWSPSSEVERTIDGRLASALRTMWTAPAIALATAAGLAAVQPAALPAALPILLLWLASPALMWWLGRPGARRVAELDDAQRAFLGRIARRTWAWFEVHVGAADSWLPPDNVQELPVAVVAHRTSPTNIGLSLLADLSAWDMGYLDADAVAARSARTLATLESLPRHRGHFYNWYDTQSLAPLPPRYVSTVDSGNLAGHLLTLRQGLLALIDAPILAPHTFHGLAETLATLEETRRAEGRDDTVLRGELEAFHRHLEAALAGPTASLPRALQALEAMAKTARAIQRAWPEPEPATMPEAASRHWPTALAEACDAAREELRTLLPELRNAATPANPAEPADACEAPIPSLRELQDRDGAAAEPARARIQELLRLAEVARQFAQVEYGFLYDAGAPPAGDRLQRRRRRKWTRATTTCWRPRRASPVRRDRPGRAAADQLVRAGPAADRRSTAGHLAVVERLDVRVPDAAAGDAQLRGHPARPDRAPRVQRQIAYGAQRDVPWGISGVRLQPVRFPDELPVPRLRRARTRPQARPVAGPGDRAVREA